MAEGGRQAELAAFGGASENCRRIQISPALNGIWFQRSLGSQTPSLLRFITTLLSCRGKKKHDLTSLTSHDTVNNNNNNTIKEEEIAQLGRRQEARLCGAGKRGEGPELEVRQ